MITLKNNIVMAEKVKKTDIVTVYGTDGGKLKAGKAYKVQTIVAEKLLAKKYAQKTAPKSDK